MSRPLRVQRAGLVYHVVARGNNKMSIYRDDLDYTHFLEILADVVERFALESWVFTVMPNHHHLVFRTSEPNLSLAMRYLNGTYAEWWNHRHQHVGHVFQGRFKGQIVESSVYLVRLCRYVLLNPVRAGLCRHPSEWRWNSYAALTGETSSPCVTIDSLVQHLAAAGVGSARARLADYVDPDADPEMAAFIRNDRRVIGTADFEEQFRQAARAASKEVPTRERRVGTGPLAEILAAAVRDGQGLADGIRRAWESGGHSFAEIARCAGLTEKAVAKLAKAGAAPKRSRPGTRQRHIPDLTPESGANQT